jgi:regulator of nonsense transcripts 2
MKLLGELYNYSLIDHPLIFDTLYYILSPFFREGTKKKNPTIVIYFFVDLTPEKVAELDPPTDMFRIRLVRQPFYFSESLRGNFSVNLPEFFS